MALTLEELRKLVAGDGVAIRGTAILEPAGGPDDKVFPPTHAVDDKRRLDPGAKYAFETRRINGREVRCVLLDSVQSQANRMEQALEALWAIGEISLPVISVDFSSVAPEIGRVTSLSAPHRIADAILRDSLSNGRPFRLSDLGKSFVDASPKNATALFTVCPTGLVFGLWDSTGGKKERGVKFQRALVSEIVGIDAIPGSKTSSRIDPLSIAKKAADIYVAADENERWTTDPDKAKNENGEPVKYGKKGKPAELNHGNVTPTIDSVAGGVTIVEARQKVVLSLAALRRLGFAHGAEEARTVLAALALLAVRAAERQGYDLRSRCFLVPKERGRLKLETIASDGAAAPLDLDFADALALYKQAVDALPDGLRFSASPGEPIAELQPLPQLVDLVKKSREVTAPEAALEEEEEEEE